METIILEKKVKRIFDGKIFKCIIPNPELGLFRSLVELDKDGIDVSDFIDEEIVNSNPMKYEVLNKPKDLIGRYISNTGNNPSMKITDVILNTDRISDYNYLIICDNIPKKYTVEDLGLLSLPLSMYFEEKTKRERALEWWNDIFDIFDISYAKKLVKKYYPDRTENVLTGREIENIYTEECLEKNKYSVFSPSLFKIYQDKFSNSDKQKMILEIIKTLSNTEIEELIIQIKLK